VFVVYVQSDARQDGNNSSSVVQWRASIRTITIRSVSSHEVLMS